MNYLPKTTRGCSPLEPQQRVRFETLSCDCKLHTYYRTTIGQSKGLQPLVTMDIQSIMGIHSFKEYR
jgi:hypothetical protein